MKHLILAAAVSLLALNAGAAEAGGNVAGQSYSRYCGHGSCAGERDKNWRGHVDARRDDRRDDRRDGRYGHGDRRFDARRHKSDHWDNRRHDSFPWIHDRGHHYGWSRYRWHDRFDVKNRTWNAKVGRWHGYSNYHYPDYNR